MKSKNGKIILSCVTFLFSLAAAGIGMGLLGDVGWSFGARMMSGCCFMFPPLLIIQMIIALFRKTEE